MITKITAIPMNQRIAVSFWSKPPLDTCGAGLLLNVEIGLDSVLHFCPSQYLSLGFPSGSRYQPAGTLWLLKFHLTFYLQIALTA